MKQLLVVFSILGTILLVGCRTAQVPSPDIQNIPQPKQTLAQKKASLKGKTQAASAVPEALGGLVKSDEWVIYKDKQQEEFKGHVSYDNGIYVFKSGYALSDRAQNTITASQNVYLKQQNPQGPTYQIQCDWGRYNYKTGKGTLKSASKNPVRLNMQDATQTVTARAKQITFNTTTQIFILTGDVHATRTTPEGTQTMQADKATVKQLEDFVHLEGNAVLSDGEHTLQADTVIYDGAKNEARAFGARPLATGTTEQGTFAIIADSVSSDAQGTVVHLDGRVQGWLVSPEINNNKINKQF
ncbi:MAG: LPS export ABC transporter periplasmic protein LptC [Elusimicrobiaceae bacterium]|nr:LPS export ABC transporter periplasmic protein LptC [Elusimicrobiaceae bacterium]